MLHECQGLFPVVRHYSRIAPPRPASAAPVIRVSNNVAQLGSPKEGPKPRQLLSLPPFPAHPLPGKSLVNVSGLPTHVTAISWIKYYFDEIPGSVVQSHFNKGLVSIRHYFFLDDGISIFSSVFFFLYEYTTWYDQCQFSAFCWADCSCSINHVCTITWEEFWMKTNLSCFYAHVHVLLIESNGAIFCKRKCLFPWEVDLVPYHNMHGC